MQVDNEQPLESRLKEITVSICQSAFFAVPCFISMYMGALMVLTLKIDIFPEPDSKLKKC